MIDLNKIKQQYPEEPVGSYAKDLTNQKFGYLTALYRTKNKGSSKAARWVCICECGNIKDYSAQNLKKGFPSCGCRNKEQASKRMLNYNLNNVNIHIGDKFGKLTVIEYEGLKKQTSRDKNESWFLCKCECGNTKSVRGNNLQSGKTLSCGCLTSIGENIIENILRENQILYKKEYTFKDCINQETLRPFRFDFAILNEDNSVKFLLEFDGRQHYYGPDTSSWHNAMSLEEIQERDEIKNQYCQNNNIQLKRIPYYDLNKINIDNILDNTYLIDFYKNL